MAVAMRLIVRPLRAVIHALVGALVVLIVVFVLYLEGRADLRPWHLLELDQEFTAAMGLADFNEYLALEARLFAQLDAGIYERLPAALRHPLNRYTRDSLADPGRWARNWNRSFELSVDAPTAGVLLLHGMSDSPYSLRALGETLHRAGAQVLGLRLPGHGTAPSGLVRVREEDMRAAVVLAMRHLAERVGERPLFIIGYSNGAALGVLYAIDSLEDNTLPPVAGLVLISPAIGVSPVAALAVWQARLGVLLGLDKLAWNTILPEYDPYQYKSFAVNAGDLVHRLTGRIRAGMERLAWAGQLEAFPPILAFSSVVDATVSVSALVDGPLRLLPPGAHELVLFDINRRAVDAPLLSDDPATAIQRLRDDPQRPFTLSVVSNRAPDDTRVRVQTSPPGQADSVGRDLALDWPPGVYSLSHVALPFAPDDPLYGEYPVKTGSGLHLGDIALRGERGVLRISASERLRLRWNPFFPYLRARVLAAVGLSVAS